MAGQGQRPLIHGDQVFHCRRLAQLLDLRTVQTDPATFASLVVHPKAKNPARLGVGIGIDQRGIDQAENRGGRANAQPQGKQGRDAECRVVDQLPHSIAEIMEQGLHRSPPKARSPSSHQETVFFYLLPVNRSLH